MDSEKCCACYWFLPIKDKQVGGFAALHGFFAKGVPPVGLKSASGGNAIPELWGNFVNAVMRSNCKFIHTGSRFLDFTLAGGFAA